MNCATRLLRASGCRRLIGCGHYGINIGHIEYDECRHCCYWLDTSYSQHEDDVGYHNMMAWGHYITNTVRAAGDGINCHHINLHGHRYCYYD